MHTVSVLLLVDVAADPAGQRFVASVLPLQYASACRLASPLTFGQRAYSGECFR
jgi:hypothetical protein